MLIQLVAIVRPVPAALRLAPLCGSIQTTVALFRQPRENSCALEVAEMHDAGRRAGRMFGNAQARPSDGRTLRNGHRLRLHLTSWRLELPGRNYGGDDAEEETMTKRRDSLLAGMVLAWPA